MTPATAVPLLSKEKEGILDKLRHIPVFQVLNETQLASVEPFFTQTHYAKEAIIFYEQDIPSKNGSKVYFIAEGCVKLVKYSTDGESTIVRLVSSGEYFGVTGALTNRPHPFSAEALNDTTVLYINLENFRTLISKFPELALQMLSAMGELLWFNYSTHNQVVKKSEARVAKIILYHLKRDGSTKTPEGYHLKIQLPHDYIASMTGIAYEESVRIMSRLKKQHNCIRYLRGGRIVVTNLDVLCKAAQDDEFLSEAVL